MRYAIVNQTTVENVIVADADPVIPDRVVVRLAAGQMVDPGDSYTGATFVPYVPTAAEIERRAAPANIRDALALLAQWANDAQDAAAITAMSATQRIQRQAVIETRVAALARAVRRMALMQGLDQ